MLTLHVQDVYQHGKVIDRITVERRHMKGGKAGRATGRTVLLHPEARGIELLAGDLTDTAGRHARPGYLVFKSRNGDSQATTRVQAWRILQEAYASNELTGKLSTHAMRKTFAQRTYMQLNGNLVQVQKALRHRNINSTVAHLSYREEEIDEAILAA